MGWFDDVRKSWEVFSARWPVFICVGLLFILLPAFLAEGFGWWYAGKTGADAPLVQYTLNQQEMLHVVQEHLVSQQGIDLLDKDISTLLTTQQTLQHQLAPYFRVVSVLQLIGGLFGLFAFFVYTRLFLSPSFSLSKVYSEARNRYSSFLGLLICIIGIAFLLLIALLLVIGPLALLIQDLSQGLKILSFLFLLALALFVTGYVFLPLQLAHVFFVKETRGPFSALERSWACIKGKRWRFFGRLCGFGFLLLCVTFLFSIVSYGLQLSSLAFPGLLWSFIAQSILSLLGLPLFIGYLVQTVKTLST